MRGEIWPRSGPAEFDRGALPLRDREDELDDFPGDEAKDSSDTECSKGRGRGPALRPSGLAEREAIRSCGGRGEIGTFHKLVSSGSSSSESWYSSSRSLTDLRRNCQGSARPTVGDRARLVADRVGRSFEVGGTGDVERDRRPSREGIDIAVVEWTAASRELLLTPFSFGVLREAWAKTPLTWPCG